MYNKKPERGIGMKKYTKIFLILFIITLLTEVLVFNMRHWESLGYKTTSVDITQIGSGLEQDNKGWFIFDGSEDSYIELGYVGQEIKNIYIGLESDKPYRQALTIFATDEGNRLYYELPQREVVTTVERSKYIKMNTAGKTEKLKIRLDAQPVYDVDMKQTGISDTRYYIHFDKILINETVPFFFEPIRFAAVFFILLVLYCLRYNSGMFVYELNLKSHRQKALLAALIALNIALAVFIYKNNLTYFEWDKNVYNNLAQALMEGRFDLPMFKATEGLKAMDNPYDTYYRNMVAGGYEWDYAYFNGKYYVYFGIVPCLIMFLPLKLLFGYNMPVNRAMLVFTAIYIVIGFRFLYMLVKRFYKKIPFALYLIMAEMFVFCGTLTPFLTRNDLYGIPILTALIFTMLGLDLWLGSIDDEGKIKSRLKLCLGSLCMALVAGCRPQLVLASFFAFVIFWRAVFSHRQLLSCKNRGIVSTLAFALPYVIVATGLMYYNYARFGSVADFGAMYNLTTNDMTKRGFRLDRIPYGLFAYCFQLPNISCRFPFLENCQSVSSYMGVTIIENMRGGAFALIPALWFNVLVYAKSVKQYLSEKKIFIPVVMCHIFALVIVIADINMGGMVLRYMADFVWLLMLGAYAVVLCIMENLSGEGKKRFRFAFCLMFLIAMVFNILLVFIRYRTMTMDSSNPTVFYGIMYAVQFWL